MEVERTDILQDHRALADEIPADDDDSLRLSDEEVLARADKWGGALRREQQPPAEKE